MAQNKTEILAVLQLLRKYNLKVCGVCTVDASNKR